MNFFQAFVYVVLKTVSKLSDSFFGMQFTIFFVMQSDKWFCLQLRHTWWKNHSLSIQLCFIIVGGASFVCLCNCSQHDQIYCA